MANLIRSLGYSLGKVHSGLINYLCALHQEGNREPFKSFLGVFDVQAPSNPIPRREWNSVDLAILDGDQGDPKILFEVKVDDHESGSSEDNYQTVRYASRWPSCDAYLFVTLGMGEYYHPPRSKRFSWIRIRQFQRALEAIKSADSTIEHWLNEVQREIDLQERAACADKSRVAEYRAGTWNIYLLGQLAETLESKLLKDKADVELTCYPYGSGPDTILNFGWSREPLYMEINYGGRLNLKISLDASKSVDTRREVVQQVIQQCEQLHFDIAPTYHPEGKIGSSKTIASFDVGLSNKDGVLEYKNSIEDTQQRLLSILCVFYSTSVHHATSNGRSGLEQH